MFLAFLLWALPASAQTAFTKPHVQVQGGAILIDGNPTFLYGGDVSYFRVRDESFDKDRTWDLWADRLDKIKAAHMNLVVAYVPWDYHELSEGKFDFSGARDLGHFLELCHERGLWVHLKPGPLITAEWPRGFGTFGAVPAWWKEAHPEALVRKADGGIFKFFPLARSDQAQPTYLHPAYLEAVRKWFEALAPIVLKYIYDKPTIAMVQVDNETNIYWAHVLGDADYSETSVGQYRRFLESRYEKLDRLNATYGTGHVNWSEVEPPRKLSKADWATNNARVADWFDFLREYVRRYQLTVRALWEELGVFEPNVLFTTNDSPFGLPLREVLLPDSDKKNEVGLWGLDTYPTNIPFRGALFDWPFQADYAAIRYRDAAAVRYGVPGPLLVAEIQGGLMRLPLGIQVPVSPQATDQLVAKLVGHGLSAGTFYIAAGGINADGSDYDYQAMIGRDGALRPRYEVAKKWGEFLERESPSLLASRDLESPIAILTSSRYSAPAAGIERSLTQLATEGLPGLYGMLLHSGVTPKLLDIEKADAVTLGRYKAAFFPNPGALSGHAASVLADYVESGGTLVNLLSAAVQDFDGSTSEFHARYASLFEGAKFLPRRDAGIFSQRARIGDLKERDCIEVRGPQAPVLPPPDAASFLWLKRLPWNKEPALAFSMSRGNGQVVYVGTDFFTDYNSPAVYHWNEREMERRRSLVRKILALAQVEPQLATSDPRDLAWLRESPQGRWLYWIRGPKGGPSGVQIPGLSCEAKPEERLDKRPVQCTGKGELEIDLPASAVAVVWIPEKKN